MFPMKEKMTFGAMLSVMLVYASVAQAQPAPKESYLRPAAVPAPANNQVEWVTQGEGAGAWLQMDWGQAHTIDQVVLFGLEQTPDVIIERHPRRVIHFIAAVG